MTNEKNTTKLNIENHYIMTDIEYKIINIEYPVLKNQKLEKELNIIYNSIQNIKELLENNKVRY